MLDTPRAAERPVRWSLVLAGIVAVLFVLAYLPGRMQIPPLVESDYCYVLIAADRMHEGLGPTAPQPVAPFQPWTWQSDWSFLTQWPIGYSLLVAALRWTFGFATIHACQCISVAACATALVGWFVWIRRGVPRGVTGLLLAAVAAGSSVPASSLVNPSTDALLVALLPFVLLFATRAMGDRRTRVQWCDVGPSPKRERGVSGPFPMYIGTPGSDPSAARGLVHTGLDNGEVKSRKRRAMVWLALAGFTAGGLFWLRYASVFVPAGVGLYLLLERYRRRVISLPMIALFALCAAIPIVALLLINRTFGTAASVQAQLNLGRTAGFHFSPNQLAAAWWNFTDLGFYDYHRFSHWVYALWPAGVIIVALCIRPARRAMRSFLATPAVALGALVVMALFGMLIGSTVVFGDKFSYVGLDRYYLPAKPLYFLFFAAPVILIPRKVVRVFACAGLLVACSWLVQQEWARPYRRWLAANREVTPYGQWARCFTPKAADLYAWLADQDAPNLIVVSNFHEYITLETGIPALPIPKDVLTLNTWVQHICESRGVTNPRVLFVLDPNNRWRDYWIKDPAEIIHSFKLKRRAETPVPFSAWVLQYNPPDVTGRVPGTTGGLPASVTTPNEHLRIRP